MNEDEIRRLLRSLPRESASEGFTDRVLQGLPHDRQAKVAWRPRLAPAAVAIVILGTWLGVARWQEVRQQEASRREEVEALRLEMEQLEDELMALRRLAADSQPVLYLGGSEEVDFVLDLRQLLEVEAQGRTVPTGLQETVPSSRKVVYPR